MITKLPSRLLLVATAVFGVGGIALTGAEQTWTGQISDAICGDSHKAMAGQVGISDHECVIQCVGSGSKYVLVTADKKVLQIANQDFKDLQMFAAQSVTVTGDLKGDAVTVTKIEPHS
jgi:hypothetical protein